MKTALRSIALAIFTIFTLTSMIFADWPIPHSGQTKCYDNLGNEITCPAFGEDYYGQDGNYTHINPRSYTKLDENGNELPDSATYWVMVRDNVTELIWEVKQAMDQAEDYSNPHDADNKYAWSDAVSEANGGTGETNNAEGFTEALNARNFGGYSDWRLPSIKELASIADLGRYDPAIDTSYFNTSTFYDDYWSSATYASDPGNAWIIDFRNGETRFEEKSDLNYIRAVRGQTTGSATRINNGDGTVTDRESGLMWQQDTYRHGFDWSGALKHCSYLTLAGYTDWRLPSREELRSIVDYGRYDPALDPMYFPNALSCWYWSGSIVARDTNMVWDLNFNDGSDDPPCWDCGGGYVRAVRTHKTGHAYLTVSVNPIASGIVTGKEINCPKDCTEGYEIGSTVQLTPEPAARYKFTGWSGACCGDLPQCSVTINERITVTANFSLINEKEGANEFTLTEVMTTLSAADPLIFAGLSESPFAYQKKAFNSQSLADVRKAFTACQAYFSNHPNDDCSLDEASRSGFKKSSETTMEISGGIRDLLIFSSHPNGDKLYYVDSAGTIRDDY